MKAVLASGNRRQGARVRRAAGAARLEVLPQTAFGIDSAAETGATFVDNALLKARHAAGVAAAGARR